MNYHSLLPKSALLIYLATCLLVFFATTTTVSAQAGQSPSPLDLSVSPPTAFLKIRPGNTAVHSVTLKNNGTSPLTVTPQLVDFVSDGSSGTPILSSSTTFPYLNMERTSFDPVTLQPQATAQLTLHFSVPASSANKEYPVTILFRADPESSSTPRSDAVTPISGTVGSNLIVLVSDTDEPIRQLVVEDFGTPVLVDSFRPLKAEPIIRNNSYAASVASGSAIISNWRGETIAKLEIAPAVILGYSSRQLEPVSASDSIQNKKGLRVFSYDQVFLIGPYTFTIEIPAPDGGPGTTQQKIIVWAVPFALLLAIIVTSFALGGYYFFKKRSVLDL